MNKYMWRFGFWFSFEKGKEEMNAFRGGFSSEPTFKWRFVM